MKNHANRILIIGIGIFSLTNCKPTTAANIQKQEVADTLAYFDTTLHDPMDYPDEIVDHQQVLDNFLISFKETEQLPAIEYNTLETYSASTYRYYYQKEQLMGIFKDDGYEGGGGGHLKMQRSYFPDGSFNEIILYVPYSSEYEKGYFSYVSEGIKHCFEVSGASDFYHPTIAGTSSEQTYEYEKELTAFRQQITQHKAEFKLLNGQYFWDIRREIVESEYGDIESFQRLEVDSTIFFDHF